MVPQSGNPALTNLDLPQKKDSLISYTLTTKEKGRIITNGVNIIMDFYLIEFTKA